MKNLGLQAYRFSISWPRVIPSGFGAVNEKGLDFYDRLVDELLAAEIAPYVTLFHWDYPYDLFLKGGWLNPDSPEWFEAYTEIMVKKLGDRVKHWITLNEPNIFVSLGYGNCIHAPGLPYGQTEILTIAHHVLKAHGKSFRKIKAMDASLQVGMAPAGLMMTPVDDGHRDVAYAAFFQTKRKDLIEIAWWLDPIMLGKYPDDGLELFKDEMPVVPEEDMALIHTSLDFVGTNIYGGDRVSAKDDGGLEIHRFPVGAPLTAYSWNILPESLYWGPRFLYERYGKPIAITENGRASFDCVSVDGKVHDPQRTDYLYRYISELERAASDGIPIHGYFLWSLFDNFEWHEGYKQRFGIVYVDFHTQERIIKDSANWYREVIRENHCLFPF